MPVAGCQRAVIFDNIGHQIGKSNRLASHVCKRCGQGVGGRMNMDQFAELLRRHKEAEMFEHEHKQRLLHIAHNSCVVPVHNNIGGGIAVIRVGIMAMRIDQRLNGLA